MGAGMRAECKILEAWDGEGDEETQCGKVRVSSVPSGTVPVLLVLRGNGKELGGGRGMLVGHWLLRKRGGPQEAAHLGGKKKGFGEGD